MLVAVARHERDVDAIEPAYADRGRRRAVRCGYGYFGDVIQEPVEPGAPEDPYHEPGVQIFGGGGSSSFEEVSRT